MCFLPRCLRDRFKRRSSIDVPEHPPLDEKEPIVTITEEAKQLPVEYRHTITVKCNHCNDDDAIEVHSMCTKSKGHVVYLGLVFKQKGAKDMIYEATTPGALFALDLAALEVKKYIPCQYDSGKWLHEKVVKEVLCVKCNTFVVIVSEGKYKFASGSNVRMGLPRVVNALSIRGAK